MASPPDDPSFYAPPRDDPPSATELSLPMQRQSPTLVGVFAVLGTSAASAFVALGLIGFWHQVVPKRDSFLHGLGEAIVAMLSLAALSAFATLTSIVLAMAILGRRGRVSPAAAVAVGIFAAGAAFVCFLPVKSGTGPDTLRGGLGVLAEVVSTAMIYFVMKYARRRYVGPPPPPPWMEME